MSAKLFSIVLVDRHTKRSVAIKVPNSEEELFIEASKNMNFNDDYALYYEDQVEKFACFMRDYIHFILKANQNNYFKVNDLLAPITNFFNDLDKLKIMFPELKRLFAKYSIIINDSDLEKIIAD